MCLIRALFAGLFERARRGNVAHNGALSGGSWSVIRVLVVRDDGPWRLGFSAGTRVVCGCFDEHLIDGKGALRRAGRGPGLLWGIRMTWCGEGGLEGRMGRRKMGSMVDIDVEGASTGLRMMSDRTGVWICHVPCRDRGRCAIVLRGADQERADRRRRCCPSVV